MATPASALETPVSMLRYSRSMPWNYDLQNKKNKEMLYRSFNLGTTMAFLGAGCSYDFISVNWMDFAREAAIQAWECLGRKFHASDEHIGHYKEKILEFAQQLRMRNSDISKLPSMSDGRRDLVNRLIQAVGEANNDATLSKAAPSGEQLRFILGACKKICEWCDSKAGLARNHSFPEFLKRLFHKDLDETTWDKSNGIHRALLALPFHRFITSNYDLTLEWFLARKLGGRPWEEKELKKFLDEKAFTQARPDSEKLARFAAGMSEDSKGMVFHCHGWCEEPDSMIVTEEDYQKWYLGDANGGGPAFRQTMELLVGSHPIVWLANCYFASLARPKMPSGANAFEISNIQEAETEV